MMDYSSICYKNNFLNQVIVRVDFFQFIQTNMVFDEIIEKEILKIFPRRGKDQIIRFNSINVVLDTKNNNLQNANNEIAEGIQREYFTNDGGNKLILSNKFIIFEINNYVRFEVHRQWFQAIMLALFQKNRISATRTGIRYINIFDTSRIKLQKNFFTSEVASSLHINLELNKKKVIENAIIDFKHYFTVPITYLINHKNNRILHLDDLFAEQITLKFSTYLARVAIP